MNLSKCWYCCSLVGEREKALELSCNIRLWVVLLLPEVLWCANLSIASRSAIVLHLARYLSQLLCRVFASHLCPLHARASQQFCTFCFHNLHRKGLNKRRSFLGKSSDVYLFFSEFFWKCWTFLWASSQVFESSLQFANKGAPWKLFFPFFSCWKIPLFSILVWRLWKQKSANPRERARVSRAREKRWFFLSKIWCPTRGLHRHEIPLISLYPFAPFWLQKGTVVSSNETGWISPRLLRRKYVFGLFCKV